MNGAFLHIATNHIPVVGLPLCALFLLVGLIRKSRDITATALTFIVLIALATIFVFRTGGPAAHVVHVYPGVTREQIHDHAEAGEKLFWSVEGLGAASLLALLLMGVTGGMVSALNVLILLASLAFSVGLGWVAHLGGLIRHPEIQTGAVPAMTAPAPQSAPASTPATSKPAPHKHHPK